MPETNQIKEKYVQVGQTALRAPDGTPYPAVPLYIKVPDDSIDPATELAECEKELLSDIGGVLAPLFKHYMDAISKLEVNER